MLSNLFQERVVLTPQSPDCPKTTEAGDQSGEAASAGEDSEREDPTDREIVDILLAADLGESVSYVDKVVSFTSLYNS